LKKVGASLVDCCLLYSLHGCRRGEVRLRYYKALTSSARYIENKSAEFLKKVINQAPKARWNQGDYI
jgi:hypothetical protein